MLRSCLQRVAGVAVLVAIGLTAQAETIDTQPVPDNIKVPDGHVAFLKGNATGTQNYICLPSGTGLAWKFQGPQATLFFTYRWFDREIRQQITTHYLSLNPMEPGVARATWQSSLDTSAVWAKKIAESNDPAYVVPGAIPWFLLQATGTQRGPMGGAILAETSYIQRVNTSGGSMPTSPCSEPGLIAFVDYTADYVFYRASGKK